MGRKDSVTASFELANTNLPTPNENLVSIISKFLYQGLSVTDMVALAGMLLEMGTICLDYDKMEWEGRERKWGVIFPFIVILENNPHFRLLYIVHKLVATHRKYLRVAV